MRLEGIPNNVSPTRKKKHPQSTQSSIPARLAQKQWHAGSPKKMPKTESNDIDVESVLSGASDTLTRGL